MFWLSLFCSVEGNDVLSELLLNSTLSVGGMVTNWWHGNHVDSGISLSSISSPYSASTFGKPNDITLSCQGNGPEQGFSYLLEPGWRITIWQSWNNYDSRHELRYGGAYPGEISVSCIDDSDYAPMAYTNTGAAAIPVYFIVDAFSSFSGDFTLEWVLQGFLFSN